MPGVPLQDIWTDIKPIGASAAERLGYPTQKPEALLERIVASSSDKGHVVLDPFCGCGTAVAAAQKLERRWIGIDITYLAISLIETRLQDTFGTEVIRDGEVTPAVDFDITGAPETVPDAQALAEQDPFQFQFWVLPLVGARTDQKKGADQGIDGRIRFHDEGPGGDTKTILIQVKSGKTSSRDVRDLVGVLQREDAEIGVLISLQEPTDPMRKEAASAGFYKSPGTNKNYPRIQLLTVEQILDGQGIDYPASFNVTLKKAPKHRGKGPEQTKLGE